jgi:hypothetical protein
MNAIKSIETTYRGARFRSRLEARWAAFYDLLGWRSEYEPIELENYIPDFILLLHKPLLVEVKPKWDCDGLYRAAHEKIEASGWEDEALIVGASWATTDESSSSNAPRVLGEGSEGMCGVERYGWNPVVWFDCRGCADRRSFCSDIMSYHCRVKGCYDGDGHIGWDPDLDGLAQRWNEAGSIVQWRAPR